MVSTGAGSAALIGAWTVLWLFRLVGIVWMALVLHHGWQRLSA